MKTIYLESTISLMASSGMEKEVAELIEKGEIRESKDKVKYLIITENEI
jgi:hypothetical protein